MTDLEVRNVTHVYGKGLAEVVAVRDVSVCARGEELVGVVGPSGCGKSTLLSIIGQVLVPTQGQVLIDGRAAPRSDSARTRMRNDVFGYLFQDFALIEQDTALDNVHIPLRYSRNKSTSRARRRRCLTALDALGVADCAHRPVRLLSGGQRQRVALARALVSESKIILADEPTGALDTANGEVVFDLLKTQADQGRLVILVTHNLGMALACDRVVALRDGHVVDPEDIVPRRAMRTVTSTSMTSH